MPQQIAFVRVLMGEDANYIGYPTKEGSAHYLYAAPPLTVRASASAEEKQIAFAFLKVLLSYDAQMEASQDWFTFGMSVRKDVLEQQVMGINTYNDHMLIGFPQIQLREDQIDNERDGEILYELIGKAKPERTLPRELQKLILEETDSYFSGDTDEETVIRNLKNRVELYLKER